MKILVIDTETTGLPKRNTSIYKTEEWPYIIQLSFILFDTISLNIIYKYNEYIKPPENITISQDSFNIHKISNEFVNKNGINIVDALTSLNTILMMSDLIIGHNISFDKQIIIVEFIRNNIKSNLTNQKYFCTMKNYVNYCKIPKPSDPLKFKYPKLSELYKTIFNLLFVMVSGRRQQHYSKYCCRECRDIILKIMMLSLHFLWYISN